MLTLVPITAACSGPTVISRAVPVAALVTSTTGLPATTVPGTVASSRRFADPASPADGDAAKAAVETAYRNAVGAAQEAFAVPDPDYPPLAVYNTGRMLATWRDRLVDLRSSGEVGRFPAGSVHRIRVDDVVLSGAATAVVDACEVDDAVVTVVRSGVIVNDALSSFHNRGELTLAHGRWQLSSRTTLLKERGATC